MSLGGNNNPINTRLRFVASKQPETLMQYCQSLGFRIEIKQIQFDGKKWVMWFIPPDDVNIDVKRVGSLD